MQVLFYVLSAITGAGAMYLLDPRMGNRRRALLRDKLFSFRKKAEHTAEGKVEHIQNVAHGKAHEARKAVDHLNPMTDTGR